MSKILFFFSRSLISYFPTDVVLPISIINKLYTVYPITYAHGFVMLYFVRRYLDSSLCISNNCMVYMTVMSSRISARFKSYLWYILKNPFLIYSSMKAILIAQYVPSTPRERQTRRAFGARLCVYRRWHDERMGSYQTLASLNPDRLRYPGQKNSIKTVQYHMPVILTANKLSNIYLHV